MATSKKKCTIRTLAKHVGLSTCTVSKVLSDPRAELSIPETTRHRVRDAARQLNYVPNVNAQRLFKRRSHVIGLLIPPQDEMGHNAFRDTHFVDMLSGIEQALTDTRYNLLLLFNRPEYRQNNRYDGLFQSGFLDGLLVWGAHRSDACWKALVEVAGPRIFLTSTPDATADHPLNVIASDHEQAAHGVTAALVAAGCRRFAWLAGKEDTSIIPQMAAGLARAGVACEPGAVLHSDYTEADGRRLAATLLERGGFDALLATAPPLARGAAAEAARRDSPVRIGCFDGQDWTRRADDRFISALTDDMAIGRLAVERIIGLIEGSDEPVRIKVPVSFSS